MPHEREIFVPFQRLTAFIFLDDDILGLLCQNWLTLKDLSVVDMAMVSQNDRSKWMRVLSLVSLTTPHPLVKLSELLIWMQARNLDITELSLFDNHWSIAINPLYFKQLETVRAVTFLQSRSALEAVPSSVFNITVLSRFVHLRSLALVSTPMPSFMCSLSDVAPFLESVSLAHICWQESALITMFEGVSLMSLEIEDVRTLSTMSYLPATSLRTLRIADCPLTSALVQYLRRCTALRELSLLVPFHREPEVTADLYEALNMHPEPLTKLILGGFLSTTDDHMASLLTKHGSRLQEFHLTDAVNVSNGTALSLAACCPLLTALTLSGCLLTDGGLELVLARCRRLCALDVSTCHEVSADFLLSFCGSTELRVLNFESCMQLTDFAVLGCVRMCRSLQRLNIQDIEQLTDASLVHVANSCKLLLELKVGRSKAVTSSGLLVVLRQCPFLRALDVLLVRGLFLAGQPNQPVPCPPCVLRELTLSRCVVEALDLVGLFPYLRMLRLHNRTSLSSSLRELVGRAKSLQLIELNGEPISHRPARIRAHLLGLGHMGAAGAITQG